MASYVLFLRGINVGTAKRLPMARLREILASLGYANITTILNSGNVIFATKATPPARLAKTIGAAIEKEAGISCEITVLGQKEFEEIVANNSLLSVMKDPSRCLVSFVMTNESLALARTLAEKPWAPDQIAVSDKAIYLWLVQGVLDSPLSKGFAKHMGASVTSRNWSTVLKVASALKTTTHS